MKKINRCILCLCFTGTSALLATQVKADVITQCESVGGPYGYLSIEKNILDSGCPTRNAIKWSTPYDGLVILLPNQLDGLPGDPYRVSQYVGEQLSGYKYMIKKVTDGGVFCVIRTVPYNYFRVVTGFSSGCGPGSFSSPNQWRFYSVFTSGVTVPSLGAAGSLNIVINMNNPTVNKNYVVRTTALLNGVSTTITKSGYTASGSYKLVDLAPTLVAQAKQGASLSFETEVFGGLGSIAKHTVTVSGPQMVGK